MEPFAYPSRFAEEKVHHPATPDVWPWLPAVAEDVGIRAPGVFKGVGQDGQAVEGSLIVDGLGELWESAVVPG